MGIEQSLAVVSVLTGSLIVLLLIYYLPNILGVYRSRITQPFTSGAVLHKEKYSYFTTMILFLAVTISLEGLTVSLMFTGFSIESVIAIIVYIITVFLLATLTERG
ncbi:hypothetical protein ACSU1N_06430 [Thermogladius sp. 4427co]|uniref:hypothetical protein n=1 Tax=Thermogladius sp. 4427co TaxID=3450718 RepID=UPI003F79280A